MHSDSSTTNRSSEYPGGGGRQGDGHEYRMGWAPPPPPLPSPHQTPTKRRSLKLHTKRLLVLHRKATNPERAGESPTLHMVFFPISLQTPIREEEKITNACWCHDQKGKRVRFLLLLLLPLSKLARFNQNTLLCCPSEPLPPRTLIRHRCHHHHPPPPPSSPQQKPPLLPRPHPCPRRPPPLAGA